MFSVGTDHIESWVHVTGMIRSGTTFVGKVLSLPYEVDYIHEPFNGGYSLPDEQPFVPRYIRPETTGPEIENYRDHIAKIFSYDFGLRTTHHPQDSWPRKTVKTLLGSRGPVYLALAKVNPFHRASVIKDPTSKLLTEFLYSEFNVRPVIVIRHPVSLAASLKRVGWWPEMTDFREQSDLVEDYFEDELDFIHRTWSSPLLEAMAHWRATHKVLLAQAAKYSDWMILTHEETSRHPVKVFNRVYDALGLPWSSSIEKKIRQMTGRDNTTEARGGQAMDLSRDSASIFAHRRDSVSVDERRAIFDVVQDVALQIYSTESFALDET